MTTKCIPEELFMRNLYNENIVGSWTKMTDFSDRSKIIEWIKSIFLDTKSIEIVNIYTQVVSGVNYLINFYINDISRSHWIEVYEPLNGPPKINKVYIC